MPELVVKIEWDVDETDEIFVLTTGRIRRAITNEYPCLSGLYGAPNLRVTEYVEPQKAQEESHDGNN